MHLEQPRARIGTRDSAMSRAKHLALKALVVIVGAFTLVSAFVLSLVFVVIGMAVLLILGGVLWWKTRELRREFRARMQEQQSQWPPPSGEVIEGEVLSADRTGRERQ